jgi:large conductance mechanosensitive channel
MADKIDKSTEELAKEIADFKKFAFKDNLLKLAIAFILSQVFEKVIKSISNNLLMPIINFFLSDVGTNWRHKVMTPVPGMTLEIGQFISAFVEFMITAIVLFVIYKKMMKWHLISDPAAVEPAPEPTPVPVPVVTPEPPKPVPVPESKPSNKGGFRFSFLGFKLEFGTPVEEKSETK